MAHTALLPALPRTPGVLKAWLEPLPDGTLPNSKVRGSVLRLLGQLPVDCAQEDRKEQLKRSGLGRIVMFLFKVPGEQAYSSRGRMQGLAAGRGWVWAGM